MAKPRNTKSKKTPRKKRQSTEDLIRELAEKHKDTLERLADK